MSRAGLSGIAYDIAKKMDEGRNTAAEEKALTWLKEVVGHDPEPIASPFEDALKDGTFLCDAINVLSPNVVKKIRRNSNQPFHVMQNIDLFLKALIVYGLTTDDIFQTVDLHEKRNIAAVTKTIYAMARQAAKNGYTGATLELEAPKLQD